MYKINNVMKMSNWLIFTDFRFITVFPKVKKKNFFKYLRVLHPARLLLGSFVAKMKPFEQHRDSLQNFLKSLLLF